MKNISFLKIALLSLTGIVSVKGMEADRDAIIQKKEGEKQEIEEMRTMCNKLSEIRIILEKKIKLIARSRDEETEEKINNLQRERANILLELKEECTMFGYNGGKSLEAAKLFIEKYARETKIIDEKIESYHKKKEGEKQEIEEMRAMRDKLSEIGIILEKKIKLIARSRDEETEEKINNLQRERSKILFELQKECKEFGYNGGKSLEAAKLFIEKYVRETKIIDEKI